MYADNFSRGYPKKRKEQTALAVSLEAMNKQWPGPIRVCVLLGPKRVIERS